MILLDLMMPEMDGFEFLDKLRVNEAWRKIPVVVVTARELTEQERSLLNGNVEKVLRKGAYSRDELLHEVRSIVTLLGGHPTEADERKLCSEKGGRGSRRACFVNKLGGRPALPISRRGGLCRNYYSFKTMKTIGIPCRDVLQRRGYAVSFAVDGKQGVAMAGSEKPDLIPTRITNLPELDGWEATRQIKSADQTRALRFRSSR